MREGWQIPYLCPVSGTCSLTPMGKQDGEPKWRQRGDQDLPSSHQWDQPGRPLRDPEGWMRAVNHGAGEGTTAKHICIPALVIQPPLNAFSSVNCITKSWR